MPSAPKPRVIVIIGPTGVGKTEWAIHLANTFNGEIVSADSRYLYRGMDLGTAKPTPRQLRKTRHHLVNVADINDPWSLAVFQRAALDAFADITFREKIPFLVGGTGQYIHCLTKGWKIPALEPNLNLRNILAEWGNQIGFQELHHKLRILDPGAANLIDYRNARRTIRALEVTLSTGYPFTSLRQFGDTSYEYVEIGLTRNRELLYQRIDERIRKMIRDGFIDEVAGLLNKGYGLHNPPLSAIGYKEIIQHFQGQMELEESIALIKRRTRQFVRQQANWFRLADPHIRWFDMDLDAVGKIKNFLKGMLS